MGKLVALPSRLKARGYFQVNFYRVHVLYFILTILLSSVIVYGSGINGNSDNEESRFKLRYIDALFLCTSAMTNTGLNTVNMSAMTAFQQSVLFVLILLGNITVVSTATVVIRRRFFRKYMQEFLDTSKGGRMVVKEIEKEEEMRKEGQSNGAVTLTPTTRRRHRSPSASTRLSENASLSYNLRHHERDHGGFPYPWEWRLVRDFGSRLGSLGKSIQDRPHDYLSFKPSLDQQGRFRSLNEHEREELGGVEYRALGVLLWLLPLYICFWLALAMVILIPWSYKRDVVAILDGPQPGRLKPGWWASFLVCSSFCNCGLNLLDISMIPFQPFYLVLIVIMAVELAGNTFFPVFLRWTIWSLSKLLPQTSRLHHSLAFLLHHPRRCFILLFPSINTWCLAAIQAALHLGLWGFWFLVQIDYPKVWPIPAGQRTIAGLFQALGVRTSGMYVISMSQVAPALLVLYTGAMYVSGLPIIISIRSSNIYEERSIGLERPQETDKDGEPSERSYIGTHLQRQLASDAWWLFIGFFLICIIERTALAIPSPGFDLYAILFDTVSAFGTVGLSTGVPYDSYSFCGAWHSLSKLILIVIMLRGRHRGLPMAIDRAVLLPGQELMERMEDEYFGKEKDDGRRVRSDEEGNLAEGVGKAQDPEQNATTAERLKQEKGEGSVISTA